MGKYFGNIKKNEVHTGKVIDLTHEGHGVVKLIVIQCLCLMLIEEEIEYKLIKVKRILQLVNFLK